MRSYPAASSAKQLEIEEEYGFPFWEVVKGFADDGESKAATASILGYSETAFRNLVNRYGFARWFPPCGQANASRAANKGRSWAGTPTQRAALAKGRVHAGDHLSVLVELDGLTASIKEHALRRGLKPATVYMRRTRGWPLDEAFSPVRGCRPDHPWHQLGSFARDT